MTRSHVPCCESFYSAKHHLANPLPLASHGAHARAWQAMMPKSRGMTVASQWLAVKNTASNYSNSLELWKDLRMSQEQRRHQQVIWPKPADLYCATVWHSYLTSCNICWGNSCSLISEVSTLVGASFSIPTALPIDRHLWYRGNHGPPWKNWPRKCTGRSQRFLPDLEGHLLGKP